LDSRTLNLLEFVKLHTSHKVEKFGDYVRVYRELTPSFMWIALDEAENFRVSVVRNPDNMISAASAGALHGQDSFVSILEKF
jgi:hypothetical protein